MHATEYNASKQKYTVLRKTSPASDSSLLSSFYVRNQTPNRTFCTSLRKKKERKKKIK